MLAFCATLIKVMPLLLVRKDLVSFADLLEVILSNVPVVRILVWMVFDGQPLVSLRNVLSTAILLKPKKIVIVGARQALHRRSNYVSGALQLGGAALACCSRCESCLAGARETCFIEQVWHGNQYKCLAVHISYEMIVYTDTRTLLSTLPVYHHYNYTHARSVSKAGRLPGKCITLH